MDTLTAVFLVCLATVIVHLGIAIAVHFYAQRHLKRVEARWQHIRDEVQYLQAAKSAPALRRSAPGQCRPAPKASHRGRSASTDAPAIDTTTVVTAAAVGSSASDYGSGSGSSFSSSCDSGSF